MEDKAISQADSYDTFQKMEAALYYLVKNQDTPPTLGELARFCGLSEFHFQIQVWQALLKIPYDSINSYEEITKLAGSPVATRASASVIARNNMPG